MSRETADVVVVGGGAIGLSCAYRLARGGKRVALVDAGELGREASWAAGGILSPVNPHGYPPELIRLVDASVALFPALAKELEETTGFSIELRASGLLRVATDAGDEEALAANLRWRAEHGLPSGRIEASEARKLVPGLAPNASAFSFEGDVSQVRTPRYLRALVAAGAKAGVAYYPGEPVLELVRKGSSSVHGVRTQRRTLTASETVLAAGAWSGELLRAAVGVDLPVEPIRGQMVLLEAPPGLVPTMVLGAGKYLIPRSDGRVLVGSTLEHAGFDKRTTAGAVQSLLGAAFRLVPELANARLERAWAGLRPGTPDRLPFLGRVRGLSGLVLATGHYRNGIVLAPVTADLVARLLAGADVAREIAPFSHDRPAAPPARD